MLRNTNLLNVLFENGVNPNSKNDLKITSIEHAITTKHIDPHIIQTLLINGSSHLIQYGLNETPIYSIINDKIEVHKKIPQYTDYCNRLISVNSILEKYM
jgi:hypothetical protein